MSVGEMLGIIKDMLKVLEGIDRDLSVKSVSDMHVFVQTATGETITLDVGCDDDVSHMKALIYSKRNRLKPPRSSAPRPAR